MERRLAGLNRRFIPVGTGNTPNCEICGNATSVHPRGHGEHGYDIGKIILSDGSSPWARGTLIIVSFYRLLKRFIPVGTGNTFTLLTEFEPNTVHPRGHGEHSNYRQLIYKGNHPSKKSTRFLKIELSKNQSSSGGKNRTSLNPSTSMGSLLFSP